MLDRIGVKASGRWVAAVAVTIYCLWAILFILQKPGLQYDEAMLVSGAVHMLNSPREFALPHDPDTWVCGLGRCLPLMNVRYIGPIKDYLCVPLFAMFGTHAWVVRAVSMLLAALGIWGIVRLIAEHVSPASAAMVGLVLAMNPAYIDLTVFDNSAVAPMMASLGLFCLAVAAYLSQRNARAALWVGAAIGFGIWARANFIWFVAAVVGSVLIVRWKKLVDVPVAHWTIGIVGALLAGAPFLTYQFYSRGGTWEGLSLFASHAPFLERAQTRLNLLSELLISDSEHRVIWSGMAMVDWQRFLFSTLVLAACLLILVTRTKTERWVLFARVTVVTMILLLAILLTSRMDLSEHHLVILLPLACVVTCLAGVLLIKRHRLTSVLVGSAGVLYLTCAGYWNISAIRDLARTGGVGVWSDSIYPLAAYLQHAYPERSIKILDWGLEFNLYVLSNGKLHTEDLFADASVDQSSSRRPWMEEIRAGGIFVLNAAENRQFSAPSEGFLRALSEGRPVMRRYPMMQRNRTGYADVIEIEPNTLGKNASSPSATSELSSAISTADPRYEKQLGGFYPIEDNSWRWTKGKFSITLGTPFGSEFAGSQLTVRLYLPQSLIGKVGPITVSASANRHPLAPETYRQSGEHVFQRDLRAAWLNSSANTFEFSLDKVLSPSASDSRELGLVVMSAQMTPK